MARLELKPFQIDALEALAAFCDAVRANRLAAAARPVHDAFWQCTEPRREFISVPQMANVPYVCLRVPTGGGKTLIAAHAVGRIAQRLSHDSAPLCLWVAPSTVIRDQTLRGLKNRQHPYFDALRESLGTPFEVTTLEEALTSGRLLQPGNATVIVTTIQSYRIDNEENDRRIYRENGYLMEANPVFATNPAVEKSLANAIRLRQPVVIMDEAHNARSRISFDSLARFSPSFVLELTATPLMSSDPDDDKYASNVLYAVSALQLAQPGQRMIKLPIELENRQTWEDVLAATKLKREQLAAAADTYAAQSGRRIRPIALIQAQPRNRNRPTITADQVKKTLIEKLNIPEPRVKIVTGDVDELGDEDVSAEQSVVEYIITVDKLREGWDCPFAYVLGSIGNVATATAVEQLMGRVLRMPDALETGTTMLDRAYAIVLSDDVLETARNLERGLVNQCGFDQNSATDALRTPARPNPDLFAAAAIPITGTYTAASLPPDIRQQVTVDAPARRIHIPTALTQPQMRQLRDAMTNDVDRTAVEDFWNQTRSVGVAPKPLDQYAQPLRIPQLAVVSGERRVLFEPMELEEYDWNLAGCSTELTERDFDIALDLGDRVTVGLSTRGGLSIGDVQDVVVQTLPFAFAEENWAKPLLVRWLNTELHRGERFAGLTQTETQAWLLRVLDGLIDARGADVKVLARKRFDLLDGLSRRLAEHGVAQLRELSAMLIDGRTPRRLETTDEYAFEIREDMYTPVREYNGEFRSGLRKHAFTFIADMNGEEAQCAKWIDTHPNVKRWVRNPSYSSNGGFSLPLSPGRFFPDFLVELVSGKKVVVEYKSERGSRDPEEQRKNVLGKLWADRSAGQCRFAWIVQQDWPSLQKALE